MGRNLYIALSLLAISLPLHVLACAQKSITLDIRTIDYKSKPYDPLLVPLLAKPDVTLSPIELTFAAPKLHPEIADLQNAALRYIEGQLTLYGYDPLKTSRQEIALPRSFVGKDELYRLVIAYGPKPTGANDAQLKC
jgi:hypothetical protein